jgi:N-acetylglucosaminyldiphosphoundecaprenol N-acetyl-beta-D-mannosaminyltransferase
VLFQRLGLEWLYRLAREPWRWRRQRVLPVFAVQVVWQRFRKAR